MNTEAMHSLPAKPTMDSKFLNNAPFICLNLSKPTCEIVLLS